MPIPYSCSIFAYELSRIIAPHQLIELSRTPVSLESKKVQVLVESLKSVKRLPVLNQGEITTIVLKLNLDDDQRLQIYAALIALGVQRLLLEYLSIERAWQVAEEVRESALQWLRRQRGNDPFRRIIRGLGVAQEAVPAESADPLEMALDAYDEGTRLSTLGQISAGGSDGEAMLMQAKLCFERAKSMLELLPKSVRDTDGWKYWHSEVEKELEAVRDELE